MKKVFVLALAFAGLTTAANAQKGSLLVGGNIDFNSQSQPQQGTSNVKDNTLGFSPTVGYQFTNHFTAGLTADISSEKVSQGGAHQVNNSWDLGPFIRYAQPLSSIFSVYGQLQGTLGGYNNQFTSTNTTAVPGEGTTFNVMLFPAVFINLKNSFGLNFNVGGLSYGSNTPKNGSATNTFDVNFGKTLSIGLSKNFGGKK
jgi:hypothetical protein